MGHCCPLKNKHRQAKLRRLQRPQQPISAPTRTSSPQEQAAIATSQRQLTLHPNAGPGQRVFLGCTDRDAGRRFFSRKAVFLGIIQNTPSICGGLARLVRTYVSTLIDSSSSRTSDQMLYLALMCQSASSFSIHLRSCTMCADAEIAVAQRDDMRERKWN